MANNKDFIVKNAVEVGGPTKVTVGDAATAGSYTQGYDLSVAAYVGVSFSVAGQDSAPTSVVFNNDGTKLYVSGFANDNIHQYSLTTAYDISTASYDSVSFNVNSQDSNPYDIAFNNTGTKLYMIGNLNDSVYQYSLSTAFDLSTASYDSVSFSVSSQETSPNGLIFNNDGTKMYICGGSSLSVHQYTLSTAFDISTASYDSVSFSFASQDGGVYGMSFNNDGTKLYMAGNLTDTIYQYTLSTAYDISTASYDDVSFSVSSQETLPFDLVFNNDGTKMYVLGAGTDTIYQYSTGSTVTTGSFDLSTGNYFTDTPSADVEYTFSNAGDVQSFQLEVTGNQSVVGYDLANGSYSVDFSTVSQTLNPRALTFKTDGSKMYMATSATMYEYNLSTGWDLTTVSYSQSKSITADTRGLFFKPDGTKFFAVNDSSNRVHEYNLSTAWDISTASAGTDFSVGSQETNPTGVFFKPDGTKMYVTGTLYDDVFEYNLSTAWDINTASYSQGVSVLNESTPNDIFFKPDGTVMYVTGAGDDDVDEYTLTTAWDVTTATFSGNVLNLSGLTSPAISQAYGTHISSDGMKLFVACASNHKIYEFDISSSTAITVTWDADIAWPSGTAPDSPAAGEKDIYTFTTDDGGTTYIGVQSGDAFS